MDDVVIQADFVYIGSLGCSFFSGFQMTVESNNVFTINQPFSVSSGEKILNYHFLWLILSSFDFKGAYNEFLRRSQIKSTVIF